MRCWGLWLTPMRKVFAGANQNAGHPPAKGDAFLAIFTGFSASPPVVNALTNSASNAAQAVSAGMIFVAYGLKMGPGTLTGAQLDSNGLLSTNVAASQMLFNERPAPIVYTSAGQFPGIVPYSVSGQNSVQVAQAAPGLYSANFSGKGQAAAFNENGES